MIQGFNFFPSAKRRRVWVTIRCLIFDLQFDLGRLRIRDREMAVQQELPDGMTEQGSNRREQVETSTCSVGCSVLLSKAMCTQDQCVVPNASEPTVLICLQKFRGG
jgi:hypothetical protein